MQLDLFQRFLCDGRDRRRFSNTVELWDSVPKYGIDRAQQAKLRKDGLLSSIEMSFCHRGKSYLMVLHPARVKTDEGYLEFYPSECEEIVEETLKKLASEKELGFLDNISAGVVFSLSQLRHTMAEFGHEVPYKRLVEALRILANTHIELSEEGSRKAFYSAPIFTELGAVSREDWRKDPKARWYVRFNSLIEACIRARTYRQFDFAKMMAHSSQLARWLYKRMAHLYLQASLTDPYRISLTTVKRDSGLLNATSLRFDARSLEKAFDEMKEKGVLVDVHQERRYGPRQTLLDVLYTLTPHPEFIRQAKLANKRTQWLLVQAEGTGPILSDKRMDGSGAL